MKRRSFLAFSAIALIAPLMLPIGSTSAARLLTSSIVVEVLSVDRESVNREEIKYPERPTVAFETSKYVAKARVTKILRNENGLQEGAVIDILYSVTVRDPPDPFFRVRPTLSAGQATTLSVSGGGGKFDWRN